MKKILIIACACSFWFGGLVAEDRAIAGSRAPTEQEKTLMEKERQQLCFLKSAEDDPGLIAKEPLHTGAYHTVYRITPTEIDLLDGSVWSIHPQSRTSIDAWKTNHLIFIHPGHEHGADEFGFTYNYVLKNESVGNYIHAELYLSPFYNGEKTFWITEISERTVVLNDGSKWDVSFWSKPELRRWLVGEIIIIGVNKGFFTSLLNPYILINCTTKDYVRSSQKL
jgi:hypothetical protein